MKNQGKQVQKISVNEMYYSMTQMNEDELVSLRDMENVLVEAGWEAMDNLAPEFLKEIGRG